MVALTFTGDGDVLAGQFNVALVWPQDAGDAVEKSGLARAAGATQSDLLAGVEGEFWHVQHRVNPASRCGVAFDELFDFQQRHGGRLTR